MLEPYKVPARFYSLDVLRGILTFFIIFFHWRHFFYDGGVVSPDFNVYLQPFFSVLRPLYTQGVYAVAFFFSLSGFIFYWLYGEPIASKAVSLSKYAAFRFSRLYPLHIVSLVLVIIGQHLALAQSGEIFVYQENDWHHLILNILFVNAWGFEKGFSYNGPAWTVSIEVLMYLCFFLVAYVGKARSLTTAVSFSFIGYLIEEHFNMQIGMGLHAFFIGGVVFIFYSKLQNFDLKHVLLFLSPVCTILWLIAILDMYNVVIPSLKVWAPAFFSSRVVQTFDSSLFATVLVIPVSILLLAVIETVRGRLGKRAHVIGDVSYALYLLHFPLQLACILVVNWLGVDRSFFYTKTSLIGFFLILWPMAYMSYFYFELPCQKYLRKLLVRK
jgi:peptidoglycan/LPS O-acetylase OafA/YrhL